MDLNYYTSIEVNVSIKVEDLVEIDTAWKELVEEIDGVSESGFFKLIDSYNLPDVQKIYREFLANFENNKLEGYAFKEFQRLNSFEYMSNPDANDNDILSGLERKIDLLRGSEISVVMPLDSLVKLFAVANEYANENLRREMMSDRNDWIPPDNFKDGTDEEQEIWQMHYKK